MRRRRHHGGIGRLCRHPVDAGKMKAADAAGLVTAGAGDVVEPPLEAGGRADISEARTPLPGRLLQGRDHVAFLNTAGRCRRPRPGRTPAAAASGRSPTGVGATARVCRNFSGITTVPRSSSPRCVRIEQPGPEFPAQRRRRPTAGRGRSGSPAALPRKPLPADRSETPSADSRCGNRAAADFGACAICRLVSMRSMFAADQFKRSARRHQRGGEIGAVERPAPPWPASAARCRHR